MRIEFLRVFPTIFVVKHGTSHWVTLVTAQSKKNSQAQALYPGYQSLAWSHGHPLPPPDMAQITHLAVFGVQPRYLVNPATWLYASTNFYKLEPDISTQSYTLIIGCDLGHGLSSSSVNGFIFNQIISQLVQYVPYRLKQFLHNFRI